MTQLIKTLNTHINVKFNPYINTSANTKINTNTNNGWPNHIGKVRFAKTYPIGPINALK